MKLGGPPPKAKYKLMTDSALVARVKGEKNPFEGSEIESETRQLQAVGGRLAMLRHGPALLRAFCIMIRRVTVVC